jgi:hypothetical protein
MCVVSVIERADSETIRSIAEPPEDSLRARLESAWKTGALHNRNQVGA